MVKKLFLSFCFLLVVVYSYGQDIITRSDGVEIKATIREIQINLITFKLFQSPDTLVYQISPQDVQTIKLADGTIKSFTPATSAKTNGASFDYETEFGRNILWFHPFDLIFSNFILAYERILSSGKVGFKIPIAVGLSSPETLQYEDFRRNNRFGSGLEVNIYPFGQGRFQYYYGPAFYFRTYRSFYYDIIDPMDPNPPQPGPHEQNGQMFAFALKNGIYYQFSKSFLISLDTGLGYRFFREPNYDETNSYYYSGNINTVYIPLNFHLGLRF